MEIHSRLSRLSVFILFMMGSTILPGQFPGRFQGTFTNNTITLTFVDAGNGTFSGTLLAEGQVFPITAQRVNNSQIQGSYQYLGSAIPFEAIVQGNQLKVYSEGLYHDLVRTNASETPAPVAASSTPEGGKIRSEAWGMEFTPPAGWIAQHLNELYLLKSPSLNGVVLVMPHDITDVASLQAEAEAGLQDVATNLKVEGSVHKFGSNGVSAALTGTLDGSPAKAFAVGLVSPYGKGATILAAAQPAQYLSKHQMVAEDLAHSIAFFKSETPPEALNWKEKLNGCKLSYFSRYSSGYGSGGYTSETAFDLCPQGFFRYNKEDETAWNPGGGTTSGYSMTDGSGHGTWDVLGNGGEAVLQLKFYAGEVWEYRLSSNEKGQIFLNDDRYLRTCNPNDQVVEARPNCM